MPKSTAYTQPPTWFTKNAKNKDAVLELTQRGWVAVFPDGRTEVVVGMKNVPKEFIKGTKKTSTAPVVEEKKQEEKVETPVPEVKEEESKEEKKQNKKKKSPEVTTEK